MISLLLRGELRVEAGAHLVDRENADIARQRRIERAQQFSGWNGRLQGDARDLGRGVHAGIRAARANHNRAAALDWKKRVLDRRLHCAIAGLTLPAGKVGPVVGDGELERARHFQLSAFSFRLSALSARGCTAEGAESR